MSFLEMLKIRLVFILFDSVQSLTPYVVYNHEMYVCIYIYMYYMHILYVLYVCILPIYMFAILRHEQFSLQKERLWVRSAFHESRTLVLYHLTNCFIPESIGQSLKKIV